MNEINFVIFTASMKCVYFLSHPRSAEICKCFRNASRYKSKHLHLNNSHVSWANGRGQRTRSTKATEEAAENVEEKQQQDRRCWGSYIFGICSNISKIPVSRKLSQLPNQINNKIVQCQQIYCTQCTTHTHSQTRSFRQQHTLMKKSKHIESFASY